MKINYKKSPDGGKYKYGQYKPRYQSIPTGKKRGGVESIDF